MSDFHLYVPASKGRRFGALFANLFLLGLLSVAVDFAVVGEARRLVIPFILVLLIAFCVFPESPGKRLVNLKVLDEEKGPVGTVQRLFRSLPYLLLYATLLTADLLDLESRTGKVIAGVFYMLVLIFLAANTFAVLFSPDGRSLLDMRLRTRVFTPSPLPGMERPTLFGIRIW